MRLQLCHVHISQTGKDLCRSIFVFQLLFQQTVQDQRDKAGHEMSFDPVVPGQEDRSRKEVVLHDTEAFFDLPPLFVDGDDLVC